MVAIVSTITPPMMGRNWIPVKNPVGSIGEGGVVECRGSYCIYSYNSRAIMAAY